MCRRAPGDSAVGTGNPSCPALDLPRPPTFSDVNIGLSLPALNFEVRPNPDLRDETSHGLEAGWRWQHEGVRGSLSIYRNRYRDLIDSRANLGVDPATGVLVFQSVNRARARIEGVEAELRWIPDADAAWEVSLAGAWARGRDTARDRPLNSVAPARVVLGVQYAPADRDWGVEMLGSGVARQPALDDSAGALFRAPGHALFDAYAWWRPTASITLNLALQNLADRRHWDWTVSRGVPANAANVDFYTRPGRSVSASVSVDW